MGPERKETEKVKQKTTNKQNQIKKGEKKKSHIIYTEGGTRYFFPIQTLHVFSEYMSNSLSVYFSQKG